MKDKKCMVEKCGSIGFNIYVINGTATKCTKKPCKKR